MPSIATYMTLDASGLNDSAEKAIRKIEQVKQKASESGPRIVDSRTNPSRVSQRVLDDYERNRNRVLSGSGLASSSSDHVRQESKAVNDREKLRAAEAAQAKREMEEFKRQDALARENARSWKTQQRDQMAMFQAAQSEKKAQRRQMEKESADDHKRWVSQQKLAQKEAADVSKEHAKAGKTSALGGATKMFAGFLTADFILRKAQENMEYASSVTAIAARFKTTTTEVQAWDKALQMNGSSLKQAEPMLDKFNKSRISALQGNAKQMAAAQTLGISEEQLRSTQTLDLVALAGKAIESGENQEAVIAAFQTMGGDGATAFVEMFQGGLNQAVQDVKDAGVLMSESMVSSFKQMGDQWTSIGQTLGAGLSRMLSIPLAAITSITEALVQIPQAIGAVVGGSFGGLESGKGFVGSLKSMFQGGVDGLDEFLGEDEKNRSAKNNAVQQAAIKAEQRKLEIEANKRFEKSIEGLSDKEKEAARRRRAEITNAGTADAIVTENQKKEAAAKRLSDIEAGIADKEFQNSLLKMSSEEKLLAMQERRIEMAQRLADMPGETDEDMIDKAKAEKELLSFDAEIERQTKAKEDFHKKVSALENDIAEKDFENSMIGADEEAKRQAMIEKRAKMVEEIDEMPDKTDDEKLEKLRRIKELKAFDGQMLNAADRERQENAQLGRHSVNSMQQIGGFLGNFALAASPEIATMNATVQSEKHLAKLVDIATQGKANFLGGEGEVVY